jgi:hypothetical protein
MRPTSARTSCIEVVVTPDDDMGAVVEAIEILLS